MQQMIHIKVICIVIHFSDEEHFQQTAASPAWNPSYNPSISDTQSSIPSSSIPSSSIPSSSIQASSLHDMSAENLHRNLDHGCINLEAIDAKIRPEVTRKDSAQEDTPLKAAVEVDTDDSAESFSYPSLNLNEANLPPAQPQRSCAISAAQNHMTEAGDLRYGASHYTDASGSSVELPSPSTLSGVRIQNPGSVAQPVPLVLPVSLNLQAPLVQAVQVELPLDASEEDNSVHVSEAANATRGVDTVQIIQIQIPIMIQIQIPITRITTEI